MLTHEVLAYLFIYFIVVYSIVWLYNLFIHVSVDGQLGYHRFFDCCSSHCLVLGRGAAVSLRCLLRIEFLSHWVGHLEFHKILPE